MLLENTVIRGLIVNALSNSSTGLTPMIHKLGFLYDPKTKKISRKDTEPYNDWVILKYLIKAVMERGLKKFPKSLLLNLHY